MCNGRADLQEKLRAVFREHHALCCVRKIWYQLQREGVTVAHCTIARLMRLDRSDSAALHPFATTVSISFDFISLATVHGAFPAENEIVRIAISTAIVGGAGGVERLVHNMAHSLSGHDVTIFAYRLLGGELMALPDNCRIRPVRRYRPNPWRLLRHAYYPLCQTLGSESREHFDLYLHLHTGPRIDHRIIAKRRAVIACGSHLGYLERDFDVVINEAPDGAGFAGGLRPQVLVPPPYLPLGKEEDTTLEALPDKYFLTVFNPYGAVKGTDYVAEIADSLSMPLVWCFSDASIPVSHNVLRHANIIPIASPTQGQLRRLYRCCTAYVSFSRSEGFGWSAVDAFAVNRPVIARATGAVNIFLGQPGLHIYDDVEELRALVSRRDFVPGAFDMEPFRPLAFQSALESLAHA